MIRLIATDMDGTLLNSQKEIPKDFSAWVCAHPGIYVAIASGRQYYTLYDEFPEICDRLIYIADNGALAFYQGEMIHKDVLAPEDVKRSLDAVSGLKGVTPIICGVRCAYMRPSRPEIEAQGHMYYHRLEFCEDLYACIEQDEFAKVTYYIENFRAAEVRKELGDLGERLIPIVSGRDWIDVNKKGVNKGNAIKEIQTAFGISPDESMAFGDYMNDYEMLSCCTESYAMENACPEIAKLAKHHTASNDDDGVMKVLRTLPL